MLPHPPSPNPPNHFSNPAEGQLHSLIESITKHTCGVTAVGLVYQMQWLSQLNGEELALDSEVKKTATLRKLLLVNKPQTHVGMVTKIPTQVTGGR